MRTRRITKRMRVMILMMWRRIMRMRKEIGIRMIRITNNITLIYTYI